MEILVLSDSSAQLQDGLPQTVKDLILADNVGSHFEEVDSWDDTLAHPIWNGTVVVEDIAKVIESAQNQIDSDCKAHIYSVWSNEAQTNVSMGLYEQGICEACKSQIGDALVENKGYIDDVSVMTTVAEIETYMASISRTSLQGVS